RSVRRLRTTVRKARAERHLEDLRGIPPRHADHAGRDNQRRPAGLPTVLTSPAAGLSTVRSTAGVGVPSWANTLRGADLARAQRFCVSGASFANYVCAGLAGSFWVPADALDFGEAGLGRDGG